VDDDGFHCWHFCILRYEFKGRVWSGYARVAGDRVVWKMAKKEGWKGFDHFNSCSENGLLLYSIRRLFIIHLPRLQFRLKVMVVRLLAIGCRVELARNPQLFSSLIADTTPHLPFAQNVLVQGWSLHFASRTAWTNADEQISDNSTGCRMSGATSLLGQWDMALRMAFKCIGSALLLNPWDEAPEDRALKMLLCIQFPCNLVFSADQYQKTNGIPASLRWFSRHFSLPQLHILTNGTLDLLLKTNPLYLKHLFSFASIEWYSRAGEFSSKL